MVDHFLLGILIILTTRFEGLNLDDHGEWSIISAWYTDNLDDRDPKVEGLNLNDHGEWSIICCLV